MKKLFKIISIIVCAVLALSLTACSASGAPAFDTSEPKYVEGIAESISTELETFVTEYKDRTTFNSGEKLAADYLVTRLSGFGYADVSVQEFTVDENNVKGLTSRNVAARLSGAENDGANPVVVLGAYYDNRYASAYKNATAFKSEAALAGGSGVASLLAVAEYLIDNHGESNKLDCDIVIVFFGASYIYTDGANEFLRGGLTAEERKNTVLMIEMQRLGCDHVYAYSDARETKREPFFDSVAEANGLPVYKITQKSPLITGTSVTDGIPYFQWANSGVFSVFADAEIPTLNLMGANWETMNLSDAESSEYPNISYTENDTLENLKKYYPNYATKMATAATLVIRALEDRDFLPTMKYDRENYPNTDFLTMSWIWYLVAIGAMIAAFIVVFAVCGHLNKKHKPKEIKPRRMKMAVFGMDYEDKNAADIFIDIQKTGGDIFPGIPNNDIKPESDGIDGIFPPLRDNPIGNGAKPKTEEKLQAERDERQPVESAAIDEETQIDEPFDMKELPEENENTAAGENKPENTDDGNNSEQVKLAPKKRNSVSAKKSVGAKKSTSAGTKKSNDGDESNITKNDNKD